MENNIIAVDFDGTLCENKYPEIGEPNMELIDFLMNCQLNGDKVILWTCRNEEQTKAAVDWCSEKGLVFDAVNENLPEIITEFGGDTRKIFANVYIDDRNVSLYSCRKKTSMDYGLKMRWSWLVNVRNLVMMATDFLSMAVLATEVH